MERMDKDNQKFEAFFKETNDARFDSRLIQKRVEQGFISRQERDSFLKSLPEEKEYEFTSAEALDAEVGTED